MAHLQLLKSKSKSLSSAEASEKEEESARGMMGRGKKEERPLPYNVRFSSGWICGSVVLAKPADYFGWF